MTDVLQGSPQPVVAFRGLTKRFGGECALEDVALTVLPGEVHGLLGENGSGKSTLIKILAGYHEPEPGGELLVRGEEVRLPLIPGQFRQLGISFVHQDLGLILSLSVLENLFIGEFAERRGWNISWKHQRRLARKLFDEFGIKLDLDVPVASLRPVQRALLAIVRAVHEMRAVVPDGGGGLLVLDEPTVFLPKADTDDLFRLVRDIVRSGSSVLFVSHDLDEVREITDRITVLRDGRVHGTVITRETEPGRIIEMIIGRQLEMFTAKPHEVGTVGAFATVRDLNTASLRDLDFDVRDREVLGLTGLVGSGFEEIPYALFGAMPCESGTLELKAGRYNLAALTPARAISAGLALIPGDRLRDGSIASLSVAENVTMQVLDRYYQRLRLQRKQIHGHSRGLLTRFDVRPNAPELAYSSLSGGNQQKVLLAKWLETEPDLLLLHEPTQGVDVGARQQIFELIGDIVSAGTSVICASSDYEQLARICDRVLVVGRGRILHTLVGDELTKEEITARCYSSL